MNQQSISTYDAIQWLLKVASANGEVTVEAMQVIVEFATEHGINLADLQAEHETKHEPETEPELPEIDDDAVYAPKRIVRPMSEYKKAIEEAAQPRMSITMPDGRNICRPKVTDTFREFILGMGWEEVHYLNFDVFGEDLSHRNTPMVGIKNLFPVGTSTLR